MALSVLGEHVLRSLESNCIAEPSEEFDEIFLNCFWPPHISAIGNERKNQWSLVQVHYHYKKWNSQCTSYINIFVVSMDPGQNISFSILIWTCNWQFLAMALSVSNFLTEELYSSIFVPGPIHHSFRKIFLLKEIGKKKEGQDRTDFWPFF